VPTRKLKTKKKPLKPKKRKLPKAVRRHAPAAKKSSNNAEPKSIGTLFQDLVAVQARLRAPGGCPWDREQTHATLKTFLIEEAYEVLDALENGNSRELAEELGDLLLQVLFHADLAREAGTFDISDVVTGIHDKMIRRHPHVFGNVKAETSSEVLRNWAQLKALEKQVAANDSGEDKPTVHSTLDGVPRSLPALLEAYQLTRRAARVGFDWETVDGILEKMREETEELQVALKSTSKGKTEKMSREDVEGEIGDILFVAVNLARFLGFDPEVALKKSNSKFKSRFQLMEKGVLQSGQSLSDLSKVELEVLWESAKARLQATPEANNNT
jgi:tetrapyrrole methylase family protein / MazG family protein